jgi:hypothetical protein
MTWTSWQKERSKSLRLRTAVSSTTKVWGLRIPVTSLKLTHIVEDELQNVLAAEHARTEQRIQNKAKNREYSGYDDDEFVEGRAGMRKKVLAKYDEDIDGPQETVCLILIDGESS